MFDEFAGREILKENAAALVPYRRLNRHGDPPWTSTLSCRLP
jgi:hypothetical protein